MVYKEIVPGDIRKLNAQSNDSKTGGGARDIRWPAKTFRPAMHRIFDRESTGRGGKPVRIAEVTYLTQDGTTAKTEMVYWPPTESRPKEDRIAQVHSNPALGGTPPATNKGRIFLALIKFSDDTVRSVYIYENDLEQGSWSAEVTDQILRCKASSDFGGGTKTVMGYYDFANGTGFCHAD